MKIRKWSPAEDQKLETNWSNLLKIRKWSPEEEDQKTTPRSAIEDLADKKKRGIPYLYTIFIVFSLFSHDFDSLYP